MRIVNDVKLDYCDVLIQPKRSESASRSDVNLLRKYKFKYAELPWEGIPIVASNMSTIGTFEMAKEFGLQRMLTCLSKHYPIDDVIDFYQESSKWLIPRYVFYTIGTSLEDLEQVRTLMKAIGFSVQPKICIDVANGYSKHFVDHAARVRDLWPTATIMAGNVATPEMVQELLIAGGVDIVKVGIGPGSVCTTRVVTGVGYPQLSAVMECADAAHGLNGHVCADGGCTCPGDVAKAFAAGADFVMLGGMLAGHDECSGDWRNEGKTFKFFGMSSKEAADKYNGGLKEYRAAEGKSVEVPHRGPVKPTLQQITGGLRSACSYTGANCLKDLPKCATFIRVNRTHNTIYG